MTAVRLIVHSSSGDGYHDVSYNWIKEEDIDAVAQKCLKQIEYGLHIDDYELQTSLDEEAVAYFNGIIGGGDVKATFWNIGMPPSGHVVTKIYECITTTY